LGQALSPDHRTWPGFGCGTRTNRESVCKEREKIKKNRLKEKKKKRMKQRRHDNNASRKRERPMKNMKTTLSLC